MGAIKVSPADFQIASRKWRNGLDNGNIHSTGDHIGALIQPARRVAKGEAKIPLILIQAPKDLPL